MRSFVLAIKPYLVSVYICSLKQKEVPTPRVAAYCIVSNHSDGFAAFNRSYLFVYLASLEFGISASFAVNAPALFPVHLTII